MKHTIILIDETKYFESPNVVLFDEIHSPIPYIKRYLNYCSIYDVEYRDEVNNIESIDDAKRIIEKWFIKTIRILTVDKINP